MKFFECKLLDEKTMKTISEALTVARDKDHAEQVAAMQWGLDNTNDKKRWYQPSEDRRVVIHVYR